MNLKHNSLYTCTGKNIVPINLCLASNLNLSDLSYPMRQLDKVIDALAYVQLHKSDFLFYVWGVLKIRNLSQK